MTLVGLFSLFSLLSVTSAWAYYPPAVKVPAEDFSYHCTIQISQQIETCFATFEAEKVIAKGSGTGFLGELEVLKVSNLEFKKTYDQNKNCGEQPQVTHTNTFLSLRVADKLSTKMQSETEYEAHLYVRVASNNEKIFFGDGSTTVPYELGAVGVRSSLAANNQILSISAECIRR